MLTTDIESTVSSGWTLPEKEDPYMTCRKTEGLGDSLLSSQSCVPHLMDGMAGEQLKDEHEASPTQSGGMSGHLVHYCHEPQTITRRYICLPRGYTEGLQCCKTPMVESILVNMTATQETWKQKAYTITDMNTWHKKSGGGSPLKEKTCLQRNHDIDGHMSERHLGLRLLLLQHSGDASRTPHHVPWNQLWQQNHIILTQWCIAHRGWS